MSLVPNNTLLGSIIGAGIAGNLISIGVFSRKKFDKFTAKNIYRASLAVDSLNLGFLVIYILMIKIELSSFFCKVYYFLADFLPGYSAWILVLISVERFISIAYPTSKMAKVLVTRFFLIGSLAGILLFCFCYSSIDLVEFKLKYVAFTNGSVEYFDTTTNDTTAYCVIDEFPFTIRSYIKLVLSCLVPFILLISFSVLITNTMRITRQRITQSNSALAKKRITRDINFARTIIFLDFVFLFFNFPFLLFSFISSYFSTNESNFVFFMNLQMALIYLFHIGPAVNFLIIFIFNKNFQSEFLSILIQIENHFNTKRIRQTS